MSNGSLLLVEDDARLREALSNTLTNDGLNVSAVESAEAALTRMEVESYDLVLSDIQMSGMGGEALLDKVTQLYPEVPVVLMTAFASVPRAVDAIRHGAADYLQKPISRSDLLDCARRYTRSSQACNSEVVAQDSSMKQVLNLARRSAAADITVLLRGESGTGKEVLSRLIHECSGRTGDFVAINCAAIPETLLESTLFGHVKGAFTGAHQNAAGKFEQAEGGTLLLDEVTEMDLSLQAKLLRVLQEREVERVGGKSPIKVDVRVIATTNRDMHECVANGTFREDLFYRLNVMPIDVPPLRNRVADIAPLATLLIGKAAERMGRPAPTFTDESIAALEQYPWPGNVRELDNVMQRALVLLTGDTVARDDLLFEKDTFAGEPTTADDGSDASENADSSFGLKEREQRLILSTLSALRGNRQATAEKLGISARTLRYKLARMRDAGVQVPAAFGR